MTFNPCTHPHGADNWRVQLYLYTQLWNALQGTESGWLLNSAWDALQAPVLSGVQKGSLLSSRDFQDYARDKNKFCLPEQAWQKLVSGLRSQPLE